MHTSTAAFLVALPFSLGCSSASSPRTFTSEDGGLPEASTQTELDSGAWDSSVGPLGSVDGGLMDSAAPGDAAKSAPNLIPNGDFELGNTLFGSDYSYADSNTLEG